MNKRKKHGWIWLIVVAVLVAAGVFGWQQLQKKTAEAAELMAAAMQQNYTVARGDIETVVVANGTLAAEEIESVFVPDGILITDVCVEAGEEVKAGQVIARLDESSIRTEMLDLQKSLKQEDGSVNKPGSYDELVAPATCRLKYLPVAEGDDVLTAMNEYGVLALVSVDGWMRLTIQTDEELVIGERMDVTWDGGSVEGTVHKKTDDGYDILVPDERAPYLVAAKLLDGGREIGSGILDINMPVAIVGYSGTIREIKYYVDESIPDGRAIFKLKNASPSIAFSIHYEARSLYARQLTKLIAYSAAPQIVAVKDGVIAEIPIKAGERTGKATNPAGNSLAYTIAKVGAVKMSIDVDELDILKVQEGATAEISLEALPEETLLGKVTGITKVGKKNNSISVFPVELTLEPDERLLVGMNGSATIQIDRAENVLLVPVAAIGEDEQGAFVNVVGEDGVSTRVAITTGRSNGDMAEVTGGLAEGDVITYALIGDLMDMTGVTVSTENEDGTVSMTDVG